MDASLNSAVMALLSQSAALSTTSTNLANSNTSGYKSVSTQFLDVLSNKFNLSNGGNAINSGGVSTKSRQNVTLQGTVNGTSSATDMAIDGNGFFVVSSPSGTCYTRDGEFVTDSSGNLYLNGTSYYLMGWPTNSTGTVTASETAGSLSNVNVSTSNTMAAKATSTYTLNGNLSPNGQNSVTTTSYTDTSGNSQRLNYSWVSTGTNMAGDNTYLVSVTSSGADATLDDGSSAGQSALTYTVETDSSGNIVSVVGTSGGVVGYVGTDLPTSITASDGSASVDTAAMTWSAVKAKSGFSTSSSFNIFDSKGNPESVPATWTAAGDNTWILTLTNPVNSSGAANGSLLDASGASPSSYSYQVSFNGDGTLKSVTPLSQMDGNSVSTAPTDASGNVELSIGNWTDGSAVSTVSVTLGATGSSTGLTQYTPSTGSDNINISSQPQDGYASGHLKSVSVSKTGEIDGTYTNGQTISLYKLAVATFAGPNGLTALSDNVYRASSSSGAAILQEANSNGAGKIDGSALENSTVDSSTELSDMITYQQAYSSASQVVSSTTKMFDQLLTVWS